MLKLALILLAVSLLAALVGFGSVAGIAAGVAQLLFFVLVVLFVASLVAHFVRSADDKAV